jgi:hypothetical protein
MPTSFSIKALAVGTNWLFTQSQQTKKDFLSFVKKKSGRDFDFMPMTLECHTTILVYVLTLLRCQMMKLKVKSVLISLFLATSCLKSYIADKVRFYLICMYIYPLI